MIYPEDQEDERLQDSERQDAAIERAMADREDNLKDTNQDDPFDPDYIPF